MQLLRCGVQQAVRMGRIMVDHPHLLRAAVPAQPGGSGPSAVTETGPGRPFGVTVLPVAQQQVAVPGERCQSGQQGVRDGAVRGDFRRYLQ